MNTHLSRDEFDALEEVANTPKAYKGAQPPKPSVCVARNSKRLVGIKFLAHRKDGTFTLTEKGAEALFVKNCIAGLRALAAAPNTKLASDVATFLGRKGYIASTESGGFAITPRGQECLTDIALNP
jgi:predicted transcriptional regulator